MAEGGVLQHLMAEQTYRGLGLQSLESSSHEIADGHVNHSALQLGNSPFAKSRQEPERFQMHQLDLGGKETKKPRSKNPPRRALSDDSPVSQAHPFLKNSSRSAEAVLPHFSQYAGKQMEGQPQQQRRPVLSHASGLISRLRQEFLSKPTTGSPNGGPIQEDPTAQIQDNSIDVARVATPSQCINMARTNFPSPSSSKQQLHGHPKSNSGGEEFLYTDRKSKLIRGNRRGPRGKSGASVARSKSLHFKDEHGSQHMIHRRPATDLGLGNEPFLGTPPGMCSTPRKRSDASTLSSGSFKSENKSSSLSQTSLNADNYFQISTSEENSHIVNSAPNTKDVNAPQYQHSLSNNPHLSGMVLTPSGVGGLPQQSMTPPGPHGPFYATVPTNPIGHHQMAQGQAQPPLTTSPPRGPPPPYPQGASGVIEEMHPPQRPNSLPLGGRVSRRKMEYGSGVSPGGLTSPAISTNVHTTHFPNYAMSAGTPVQGTGFFALAEAATTATTNVSNNTAVQTYQALPKQQQQPPTQSQFTRNGSGGLNGVGFHPQAQKQGDVQAYGNMNNSSTNTSLSSSSSSTVVGTPVSYQQQQRYDSVPPMRAHQQQPQQHAQATASPSYGQQFTQQPEFAHPNSAVPAPASGYSLGKSDSVNSNASTSSGGSRIARRAKRNSKNFSNTSGSSSSTGNSRPNSSADFLERIMTENDMLKTQLQTANQKLKKYQNVEQELLRVAEEHKALHSSAAKSEEMERILRTQWEATNRRTQNENDILRERINTLTELVETLQSTTKDAQTTSSSDIMMYKVKVQDLETEVRKLQDQLYDAEEKIKDQQDDIALRASTLRETQDTIASLREKLLEKEKTEKYVEHLSPVLDMLSTTVRSRLQVENELGELVKLNQRRSTSSNDEGISEMDSVEAAQASQAGDVTQQTTIMSRDEQLIRTHAQMLKWQHMYLEATLFQKLSAPTSGTSGEDPQGANGPLYNMLYRHRHAASDPSFNKNAAFWFPSWDASPLNSILRRDDADLFQPDGRECDARRRPPTHRSLDNDSNRSSPRRRRRETAPTQGDMDKSPCKNLQQGENRDDKGQCVIRSVEKSASRTGEKTDEASTNTTEAVVAESNEFDSPSEGYHSQQSSGSPTPSSERSSLHFPDGDSRVTAALASVQDNTPCATGTQVPAPPRQANAAPAANAGLYILGSSTGAGKTVLTKVADV